MLWYAKVRRPIWETKTLWRRWKQGNREKKLLCIVQMDFNEGVKHNGISLKIYEQLEIGSIERSAIFSIWKRTHTLPDLYKNQTFKNWWAFIHHSWWMFKKWLSTWLDFAFPDSQMKEKTKFSQPIIDRWYCWKVINIFVKSQKSVSWALQPVSTVLSGVRAAPSWLSMLLSHDFPLAVSYRPVSKDNDC
jgi:hypothetical protein